MTTNDVSIERLLAAIGEAGYWWSIPDDTIAWSDNAASLFGLASVEPIATGKGFARLLDGTNLVSRHEQVTSSASTDDGQGVPYQIEYAIRPGGPAGPLLWVEDTGRWYSDGGRRAVRAEGVVRVINERHAREQRLAFLSRYDEQTGLFNRSHLLDLLDETIQNVRRFRSSAAFMVVAIDDFRLINDAYGLQAGDRALTAVAQRIRGRLRDGDAIGRYSGNKIGLLLTRCEEHEMAVAAERFLAAVRDDVVATTEGALSVTISIGGVAIPRHARTRDEVMERVQESLNIARGAGRGRFVAFVPSPERAEERRGNVELARQLVGALADKRLRLAFQPVVDAETRKPVFHEALLRLVQPDGSIVSAGQIVPIADRLGLARLFDLAMLDLVLAALAANPEAVLSVNVTPETAAGPDWLSKLTAAVQGRANIGKRLIVEITEVSAIRNLEETAHFVAALHRLGVRLAIDDFGAGFTSFRNLRALSVDMVKIDGSFIQSLAQSPDDQIFVRHLVELCRDLGIETVAEWVQDEASAALLTGWGVDRIQGNLYGEASLDLPWK